MFTQKIISKIFFIILSAILLFQTVRAGDQGMTEEQMQQMMQNAEKMQECLAKIDQSAMQSLTAKGEKMREEVQALCAADKRDEARNAVMKYSKEMANSKEMEEMKKCGEMAMQSMPQMAPPPGADGDYSGMGHVCDGM